MFSPQLVTIAAGNGACSGRQARLVAEEVLTFEHGGEQHDVPIGVVLVDDIPRRFAMASLAGVAR